MILIASQITSLMIVYSTVYSDADQRKHQSSASLGFVRGIHRGPVNSPHKWPVTRKMFPFDDVIMISLIKITHRFCNMCIVSRSYVCASDWFCITSVHNSVKAGVVSNFGCTFQYQRKSTLEIPLQSLNKHGDLNCQKKKTNIECRYMLYGKQNHGVLGINT